MAVKLAEYELTCNCDYKLYDVILDDAEIETTGDSCIIYQIIHSDYGLEVSNTVDLREWAAEELNKKKLLDSGKEIAGIEIEKPKSVTTSAWDRRWLSRKQICYACLDAYISFEVLGIRICFLFPFIKK